MDYAEHVPAQLRDRFVTAYRGQYGWWFEFDGSVRFDDVKALGFPAQHVILVLVNDDRSVRDELDAHVFFHVFFLPYTWPRP